MTVLNTAQSLEIKGLTDSTESSGSGAPARPPDPPSKRSSPSPARRPAPTQSYTPAPALADDDIQEVTPVKVEPAVVAGEVAVRPGYSEGSGVAHNQVQPVADTSLQYIEQYQEDYGEYEEEEYYQAGEMQETDRVSIVMQPTSNILYILQFLCGIARRISVAFFTRECECVKDCLKILS